MSALRGKINLQSPVFIIISVWLWVSLILKCEQSLDAFEWGEDRITNHCITAGSKHSHAHTDILALAPFHPKQIGEQCRLIFTHIPDFLHKSIFWWFWLLIVYLNSVFMQYNINSLFNSVFMKLTLLCLLWSLILKQENTDATTFKIKTVHIF